ncbi:hypothetical protein pb186bvf_009397 [Paramecium bursaria]
MFPGFPFYFYIGNQGHYCVIDYSFLINDANTCFSRNYQSSSLIKKFEILQFLKTQSSSQMVNEIFIKKSKPYSRFYNFLKNYGYQLPFHYQFFVISNQVHKQPFVQQLQSLYVQQFFFLSDSQQLIFLIQEK